LPLSVRRVLRVEASAEAFTSMNDDLFKEKKAVQRQWAKREEKTTRMMEVAVGVYRKAVREKASTQYA